MKLGRIEESIIDYNRAIEIDPTCADAYFSRGIYFSHFGRSSYGWIIKNWTLFIWFYKGYRVWSTELWSLYTSRYYFVHPLGFTLNHLGRSEEAIIDYNSAIKIDPKNAKAYCLRGK